MSEKFQRGDRYIEPVGENRFHIHIFDGSKWQHRHIADKEGATNYITKNLQLLRIDRFGGRFFRPKK